MARALPFTAGLTPRGRALRQCANLRRRGVVEQPPNSNCDRRKYGIRWLQDKCAGGGTWLRHKPWCGCFCFIGLWRGGAPGISWRQASVELIEQDARNGARPFRRWAQPSEWRKVLRGDLVVLFGHGTHVEMVRGFKTVRGKVYVVTEGGNTSPQGGGGSQSNGGGAYRRVRPLSDVHGFAIVSYRPRRKGRLAKAGARGVEAVDAAATKALALTARELETLDFAQSEDRTPSDAMLYDALTIQGNTARASAGRFLVGQLARHGWDEVPVNQGERGA